MFKICSTTIYTAVLQPIQKYYLFPTKQKQSVQKEVKKKTINTRVRDEKEENITELKAQITAHKKPYEGFV